MIAILCATVPKSLTAEETARIAVSLFPSRENEEYFNKLRGEKNDDGIKESFFATVTLANALKMLPCRTDTESLTFEKSEIGKPYFKNSSVKFSISHSKGRVVCAVSDEGDVGVDIECSQIDGEKAKKLAKRYFATSDAEKIENDPSLFRKKWCEKEAETKFFGKELALFLKDERENEKNNLAQKNIEIAKKCIFYSFMWDNNPVALCSEHKNSTIIFKIQP